MKHKHIRSKTQVSDRNTRLRLEHYWAHHIIHEAKIVNRGSKIENPGPLVHVIVCFAAVMVPNIHFLSFFFKQRKGEKTWLFVINAKAWLHTSFKKAQPFNSLSFFFKFIQEIINCNDLNKIRKSKSKGLITLAPPLLWEK